MFRHGAGKKHCLVQGILDQKQDNSKDQNTNENIRKKKVVCIEEASPHLPHAGG